MGLFDFLRKKDAPQKKGITDGLKIKTVNYVALDLPGLAEEMEHDPSALLRLVPVNYYALKESYIEAAYYFSEDYEKLYVSFRKMETVRGTEKCTARSGIYPLTFDIYKKAMLKVGVTVNKPE